MKEFMKVTVVLISMYVYGRIQRGIGYVHGAWNQADYYHKHKEDD